MGMVWVARLADDEQVARIKGNPDSAYDFVNPEDEEDYEAAKEHAIDLDKEWHATHFLLTGSSEGTDDPLSFILGNYWHVGPDIGYGPVYHIEPAQISAFHSALSALSDDAIARRYDTTAMVENEIYLAEALADEGDESRGFLMERISQLRDFAKMGAESGLHAFCVIT